MCNDKQKRFASPFFVGLLLPILLVLGCVGDESYPNRPILLICPWAQGGGTDRVSRTIAAHLEQELGAPVNVVNATGGKGVTGHSRGLTAKPDGYTLMMATLELNMMHWIGLTSLTVQDCSPLMSINEDYAALLVRSDSPWKTLADLETAIRQSPGQLTSSGTTTGGAWHLALAGWLIDVGLRADAVNWIAFTGAAPSLQELISGGLDMVCCSLPEANALLESNQVRALGVMAPQRAVGYENIPTFSEQGSGWTLGGWRAIVLPNGAPADVRQKLATALERIVTGQTKIGGVSYPDFMEQQGFDHTYRTGEPLVQFFQEADEKFGKLLTSEAMASVRTDPFSPMVFPITITTLMVIVFVGLVISRHPVTTTDTSDETPQGSEQRTSHNLPAMFVVVLSILAYWLFAETVGFVLISSLILFALLVTMRAPWKWTLVITFVFPVLVYQLFAHGLRVPLPQGWIGW